MAGFKRATKKKAKVRAAFFGPSGAGKTFTMLRTATGMGGKIALIDSEHGSASKYADRFAFDSLDIGLKDLDLPEALWKKDIDAYVAAIEMAKGYDVLIIDSMSHAWQELLEEIDKLAATKFRGNTWSAWSEGTPKQKKLIEAILEFPGHVLCSMRSKTAWEQEKDEKTGKSKPVRVGLAPEQRAGMEYEFDLLVEINVDHFARILKDRSGKFQDKIIDRPGEEFGQELAAWLEQGETAESIAEKVRAEANDCPTTEALRSYKDECRSRGGWWWSDIIKQIITERVETLRIASEPQAAEAAEPAALELQETQA